ncbi:hypothetical protein AB0C18_03530 [Nonomuraea muscovyensis]|uniref:hypothetical protein n=1 Tax=Nonomuraea muscovyensis TaxID=1124761 RepID=UPI00340DCCC0
MPDSGTLERAVIAARERGAVVLCAEPGSGRRITAVSVAADLGLVPEWLTIDQIDQDDVRAGMQREAGKAYLLNLQESDPDVLPAVGRELGDYITRLREVGSCLVVLATGQELSALDLAVVPEIVKLRPSDRRRVFLAHLEQWFSPDEASAWVHDQRVGAALDDASTQDAVTLAEHVHESGHRAPHLGADEVLAAYHHWETELKGWFSATQEPGHGYRRALLLAVAALEGAPVGRVFSAADRLCEAVGIDHPPGRGLTGPGIRTHLQQVNATCADGAAVFERPRYGSAVLDHVWADRPNFQEHLTTWLRGLDDDRPAEILLRLAMDNRLPDLVVGTVEEWAGRNPDRAAGMLTAAAMSDELGRALRGKMYQWAKTGPNEALLVVVAMVCGGPLADTFDRIAFTRLKHLAGRRLQRVDAAVLAVLAELVTRPRLRARTIAEVVKWAESGGRAQAAATDAFLHLSSLRTANGSLVLVPESTREASLITTLADGWRAVLRAPERTAEAKRVAVEWLEDVAQGRANGDVICQVFPRACRSSMDTGLLTRLVWHWSQFAPDDGVDREGLCVQLMRRIGESDRLTPGLSPAYDVEGTPGWDS